MTTLQDLGEHQLLQRLQRFCPDSIVGDDGAILPIQPGYELVVTTDVLVEGVHFSEQTTRGFDVGWRAAAANLSDLAAMGAEPIALTVGLSLPPTTPWSWLEAVYQGLAACTQQYHTAIVGGDLCRSPVPTLAITALGQVQPPYSLKRSAAQVGDRLLITGTHGLSRAGLELLLHPQVDKALAPSDRTAWITAHQRPRPRLDILPSLRPWQTQRAIAAMDSSDGLADAVVQLCHASGVGAIVWAEQLPLPNGLVAWQGQTQALDWALYGGEDFELVLALPPNAAIALKEQIGGMTAIVGEITASTAVQLEMISDNGERQTVPLDQAAGFQHFA
ncbi:MAG: thiamine-phosphate kinase [Cyanobacteria bacterium P01_G01_bin.54]